MQALNKQMEKLILNGDDRIIQEQCSDYIQKAQQVYKMWMSQRQNPSGCLGSMSNEVRQLNNTFNELNKKRSNVVNNKLKTVISEVEAIHERFSVLSGNTSYKSGEDAIRILKKFFN